MESQPSLPSWMRLLASASIYNLEVPCFLGCLPEFPVRVAWVGKHSINTCPQWGRNTNKISSNHVRNIHNSFIRNRNTKLRPYVYRLKNLTRKPSSATNLRKNPLLFLCSLLTRTGDEVDAGPWRGKHPAVVVERPHLPQQHLHHLRLEFCKASPIDQSLWLSEAFTCQGVHKGERRITSHDLVLAVECIDGIGDVFGGRDGSPTRRRDGRPRRGAHRAGPPALLGSTLSAWLNSYPWLIMSEQ